MSSTNPFSPIHGAAASHTPQRSWTPIVPVPAGAPTPPAAHPKLGRPAAVWTYRSSEGVLGYVYRFNVPAAADPRGKEFRPPAFARHPNGAVTEWRWQGFPEPKPLYNGDKLTGRPSAPVI